MVRRFLLRLILEEAIRREEEAYRFYEAAREPVREPAARELLKRLCAEELRHRLKLEELQRSGEVDQEVVARNSEEAELLMDSGRKPGAIAPETGLIAPETGLGAPAPVAGLTVAAPAPALADLQPADVWRLALRKERLAVAHYGLLSRRIALRGPRQVFAFLTAEEQRHVDWVLAALEGPA
jgi:rubrerythrin